MRVAGPTTTTRKLVMDWEKLEPPHLLDQPMPMSVTATATMENAGK